MSTCLGTGTYMKGDRMGWHDYFSFSSIVCEGAVLFFSTSHTLSFLMTQRANKELDSALKSKGVAGFCLVGGSAGCGLQGVLWRVVILMHERPGDSERLGACYGIEWSLMNVY
jgi:hypothetical protein